MECSILKKLVIVGASGQDKVNVDIALKIGTDFLDNVIS